jgi:hypothetical protein
MARDETENRQPAIGAIDVVHKHRQTFKSAVAREIKAIMKRTNSNTRIGMDLELLAAAEQGQRCLPDAVVDSMYLSFL